MWPGPYGEFGSKKNLTASIDQSLNRMGLDYVDIFYSHRPDVNTPFEETAQALDLMVRQGKALYIGISNYSAEQTAEISAIFKELKTPFIIHQPSYSMFNRWIEDGLQDVLSENGTGTIAYSPLAQGMLTDRYLDGIPEDSRAGRSSSPFLQEDQVHENIAKSRALNEIAKRRGQSLAQMAVAWILRDQKVTSVLIGASRVAQLEDNVKALDNIHFTAEELNEIDAILNESKK